MVKKSLAIPILVIILILTGSMQKSASAAPPMPPILMDGGIENTRIAYPSSVNATDGTFTTQIGISWGSVGGATYYEVYRSTSFDPGTASLIYSPLLSPYYDTTANPGVYYYYWVKACDPSECSSLSFSDRGDRALTPPASVSASDGLYTDRVGVTWSASSGASYYQIWRNTVNNSGSASQIYSTASTNYDDSATGPGVLYYYWVKACASPGCSDFSSSNTGYRAISSPAGIGASDGVYTDRVQLNWSSTSGASLYNLYRSTSNSSGGAALLAGSLVTTSFGDTSATPGTVYYYWVKGCNTSVCSDFSPYDSGYRALIPPTGVSATDGTFTTKVDISWSPTGGATFYEIWRNTNSSSGGASQLTGNPTSGPFSDTTATPGTLYYYWVKACVPTSCSNFSNYNTGFRALTSPSGISASDGTYTNRVEISWSASTGADYYQIWRNTNSAPGGASQLSGSPTTPPYGDTTAGPGIHYYYWVKACSGSTGCSDIGAYDDGYRAITPPAGISASDGTYTDHVQISWSSSTGATFYEIWRNTSSSSGGASKLPGDPSSSPYNDTTAAPGLQYFYWVKGCSTTGCSDFSSLNTGYRAITPPTGVLATDGSHIDRVEIFWSASSGASYYEIWRSTTNSSGGASKLGDEPTSSPYNDTTASPGTQYYYWVKGCVPTSCSDFSLSDPGYRAITAPTSITASDGVYTDRVLITWSPSSGATSYEVWRNTTNSPGSAGLLTTVGTNSLNDTTATPGAQYYYWIKGCSTVGCSDLSSYDPGFRALTPPTGVSASDGSFIDKVEVSWNPSSGAAYYVILRNTSSNPAGASQLSGSPSTSPYSDTTATPGMQYYYWVKACVSSTGCSDLGPYDDGYRAITPPTGVSATEGTFTDRVDISWSPATGATFYEIWRSTSDTPGGSQITSDATSSPFSDTTGAPGQLYYYWVKGCKPTSCSDFSASDSGFRAITPPTGVSATDGTYTDKVTISWSASSGAIYYEVWRMESTRSGGGIEIVSEKLPGEPSASPYNDTSASPGIVYTYWVKACSDVGCSDFSASDGGYRAPTAPTGISATDGTYTDRVEVSWNPSTGAAFYTIWRNTINDSASASDLGVT
ncbi:MAG: hypothetical protein MUO67_14390, partial [Anaerolineales bacterium]|nr:hypothetical protein [Anaerolineales bacterium]